MCRNSREQSYPVNHSKLRTQAGAWPRRVAAMPTMLTIVQTLEVRVHPPIMNHLKW